MISRTQIYTVHINPELPYAVEKPVFVREGFSIMAFIFGTLWALYNRLWLEALVIFSALALLATADSKSWLAHGTVVVLNFAMSVILGLQGNDLRRAALARKGYILSDIVVSDSELRAQQRYFDRVLAS